MSCQFSCKKSRAPSLASFCHLCDHKGTEPFQHSGKAGKSFGGFFGLKTKRAGTVLPEALRSQALGYKSAFPCRIRVCPVSLSWPGRCLNSCRNCLGLKRIRSSPGHQDRISQPHPPGKMQAGEAVWFWHLQPMMCLDGHQPDHTLKPAKRSLNYSRNAGNCRPFFLT